MFALNCKSSFTTRGFFNTKFSIDERKPTFAKLEKLSAQASIHTEYILILPLNGSALFSAIVGSSMVSIKTARALVTSLSA